NYPILSKFAKKFPIFPDINNQRSMLYIDNLTEFIRLLIDNNDSGLYFPQNKEYVKTSEIVQMIASISGNKLQLVKLFNPVLIRIGKNMDIVNKVFGSFAYDKKMSVYKENYIVADIKKSIEITENTND